jgi:hypothetical protein
MSRLLQRLAQLEQALQPGRFLVFRPDPTLDLDEQFEVYRAENDLTARDTLVILQDFSSEWDQEPGGYPSSQTTQPHSAAS